MYGDIFYVAKPNGKGAIHNRGKNSFPETMWKKVDHLFHQTNPKLTGVDIKKKFGFQV